MYMCNPRNGLPRVALIIRFLTDSLSLFIPYEQSRRGEIDSKALPPLDPFNRPSVPVIIIITYNSKSCGRFQNFPCVTRETFIYLKSIAINAIS